MSRTKRSTPRNCKREDKTLGDYLTEWADVYRGEYHAHQMHRWNQGLGRDGGYHSGVHHPFKSSPDFINSWCDAIHAPHRKGGLKRTMAKKRRAVVKIEIAHVLHNLEDWA